MVSVDSEAQVVSADLEEAPEEVLAVGVLAAAAQQEGGKGCCHL